MLGGIFNIVLLLIASISTLLIYSLLMVTAETKVFDNGVLRMVGVTKLDCVLTISMQSLSFVVPSLLISYGVAILANHYLLAFIYTPEMGIGLSPFPDFFSTTQAVVIGFVMPMLASILPIQKVMSKTISESMSTSRPKGVVVEIS